MDRTQVFDVIKSKIHLVIEGTREKDIVESDSMVDYGADSLEIVEVVSRSMKELKIKVPRTELSTAANLGELIDLFEKGAATQST